MAASTGQDVVFDLRDVTFMDSAGLRALVEARWKLDSSGLNMSLVNVPPSVAQLSSITQTARYLRVVGPTHPPSE